MIDFVLVVLDFGLVRGIWLGAIEEEFGDLNKWIEEGRNWGVLLLSGFGLDFAYTQMYEEDDGAWFAFTYRKRF